MRNTTKRFAMVAAALFVTGLAGACADEPMAPQEEAYEVQMEETTPPTTECLYIGGQLVCK
ncbi:MAG TPA: hypothetical protein VF039_00980 [Longimicrobiales bacterium]